jgi:hypothetical protein
MATVLEKEVRRLRRWARRAFACFLLPAGLLFDLAEWVRDVEFVHLRRRLWLVLSLIALCFWMATLGCFWCIYQSETLAAGVCGKTGVWTTATDDCLLPPLPLPQHFEILRLNLVVSFDLHSILMAVLQLVPAVLYLILACLTRVLVSAIIFPKTTAAMTTFFIGLVVLQQDTESDSEE